jgi:hypothetical protein
MVPWLAAAVIAVLRTGSPQAATLAGMPVPGRDRAATELNYIRTIYGRTP